MTRLYRIARRLVRKALKPAALQLNAWFYKVSEDEIQMRVAMRANAAIGMQGAEADFFAASNLRLQGEIFRLRLHQRKLRAERDRIHQW